MKITDLQVDGFGVLKGLTVDALQAPLTVFYGPNETGKTTLMQFVRAMLFGFTPERAQRYLPPVYGGLPGGSLTLQTPQGDFELQRHFEPGRDQDPTGDLAITGSRDGTVYGRGQMARLTASVDETIFNNVFAVGLREIQELGTLNATDAAEHLYKLTSGLDRVSLIDVMRQVAEERERLWSAGSEATSRLDDLHRRRRELECEIDELKSRSRRWLKGMTRSGEIVRRVGEIDEALARLDRESRLLEVAMQISERWQTRRVIDQQIGEFAGLPDERDLSLEGLDDLNRRIAQQRERYEQWTRERGEVRQAIRALSLNRGLLRAGARIDALVEHLPWIDALRGQVERLNGEIEAVQLDLDGDFDGFGQQLKIHRKQIRALDEARLAPLRGAAREVVEQREQAARAEAEVERAAFEAEEQSERWTAKASVRGEGGTLTLEDAGQLVNRLRRRVELDAKIEKLQRARHDLELEIDDIVADQVLPVEKLAIVGAVFITGVVLLGFGVWLGWALSQQTGSLLIVLSAAFGLLAVGLKHHWEGRARQELDDFRSQFDMVRQQTKRAMAERDELDGLLPGRSGSWESQLKEAELQLQRMEDLVPLENRVKVARQNVEESRRLLAKQRQDVEAAEARWKVALRGLGLPDGLEPMHLKEVAQRSERLAGLQRRADQLQAELAERNRELAAIEHRIDQMLQEVALGPSSGDPAERLEALRAAIADERKRAAGRRELMTRHRGLTARRRRLARDLESLQARKQRALTIVGASDDEHYRRFALQHEQRKRLLEKRKELSDQIAAAVGTRLATADVERLLEQLGPAGLERRWEQTQTELEQLKSEQSGLQRERGEITQELKTLGEDSRLDEARLELNACRQQLAATQRQWQVAATCALVLDTIRAIYESQRQPETLREASSFLEKLTDGTYVRVWTKMVGAQLLIDNAQGETLKVELLSRGTQEAVYLALRLALVGAYARRGAILPMILDDVLVNFDSERTRSAATTLRDFAASGYQILMFTCHEHLRDLFAALAADVRLLPHHRDLVRSGAVPVAYAPAASPAEPAVVQEPPRVEQLGEDEAAAVMTAGPEPDSDLAFEIAAVDRDQQRAARLRDELIFYSGRGRPPLPLDGELDPPWQPRRQAQSA